jgi:accessory gene regulator B
MIDRLAGSIASLSAQLGVFPEDRVEDYTYGYKLLLSTVANIVITLVIGAVFGLILEAVLFTLSFAALRSLAGGFHAQTHTACISIFSAAFLVFAITSRMLIPGYVLPYVLALVFISSMIVYIKAPVAAPNKPLSPQKRSRLRRACTMFSCINLTAALFVIAFAGLQTSVVASYFFGVFAASISLLAAGLLKRKEDGNNV